MEKLNKLAALALIAVAGCSPEPEPELVYVPADDYAISVEISAPAEARAGEWIVLSAQRRSGPWKRVKRAEAPAGFVPFERPPPQFEAEVADNLHWLTDPPGARFELPDGTVRRRKARFEQPGTYRVWARSAYPTDGTSNVVTIRIR